MLASSVGGGGSRGNAERGGSGYRAPASSSLEAYSHIFPPEAPAPTLERLHSRWESWLGSAVLTAFVAEMAGRPVGIVLAGADPSEASLGHVARMYVAPDCWGQGIGRLLHGAAIDHLRAVGYDEATLWVLERNSKGSIVVRTPGLDGDW